jgi:hypothetical protein
MKTPLALIAALLAIPAVAAAHSSSTSISAPSDGQEFLTDAPPLTVLVEGAVVHSNPGNASGFTICVYEGATELACEADCQGLGNHSTCNFSVPVDLGFGEHTLRIVSTKDGAHGSEASVTVTVSPSTVACDEKDPPALANAYLNSLDLPQSYQQIRGAVIRQIANAHSNGKYGSCTYDQDCVETDVDAALQEEPLSETCE